MKKSFIFSALVIGAAAILPLFLGNFTLRNATDILIFAILASSWNIIGGYTGYASFGNIVFFGLGAYTTAILMSNFGSRLLPGPAAERPVGRGLRLSSPGCRSCASRGTTSPSPPWGWRRRPRPWCRTWGSPKATRASTCPFPTSPSTPATGSSFTSPLGCWSSCCWSPG